MDYKTEQETEAELIQSVYPDETEILNGQYPQIKLKVVLPSVPRFENPEPDFYVTLLISLPEKYPDDPPNFDVSGFPDDFPKKAIDELNNRLVEQSKSMPGYQVLITLITELQYQLPLLLKKIQQERDDEEERIRDEKEEAERKKFEGNRVTVESFNKWRVAFEKEFFAAELEAKKAQEALIGNKLTGRQLFLRDSTLNMSDLAMLDNEGEVEGESVEIDKSLFEEEFSDLEVEDEDETE
ncbi:RWD domain containing protein [Aphelenchoides besseyi]|nr:RWD domain containing protein [Aphelenchoides besseyi]